MSLLPKIRSTRPADVAAVRASAGGRSAAMVAPSGGLQCQLCHLACEAIGDPIGKQACHIACEKFVC